MSDHFARHIGVLGESDISRLVRRTGRRLAAVSHEPERHFTFEILDMGSPNALSFPDGTIFITRGLLALLNSEEELAFVLGHEIGHVTGRHSRAQITRESLLRGIALLGTPLLAGPKGGLGDTLLNVVQPGYSRDQEREADLLGLRYGTQAGLERGCGAEVLQSFARLAELDEDEAGHSRWSATHPAARERYQRSHVDHDKLECAPSLDWLQGLVMPDAFTAPTGVTWIPRLRVRILTSEDPQELEVASGRRATVLRSDSLPAPIVLERLSADFKLSDARDMALQWPGGGGRNDPRQLLFDEEPLDGRAGIRLAMWERRGRDAHVTSYRWLVLGRERVYLARTRTGEDDWQHASDSLDDLARRLELTSENQVPRIDILTVEHGASFEDLAEELDVWDAARLAIYNGMDPGSEPSSGARIKVLQRPAAPR